MQLVKKTRQKRSPHLCIRAPGVGGLKLIFKAPKCFAVYLIFFSFFLYHIFKISCNHTNFDGYMVGPALKMVCMMNKLYVLSLYVAHSAVSYSY